MPSAIDLAATVRRLRQEKRLSGVALCEKTKTLDPRTLTAFEKGRIKNPSIQTLKALAEGLDLTISDLFRQAEMQNEKYFCLGSQKGIYKMDFPSKGIQLISFTPLAKDFFCGKVILESQKEFDQTLLAHSGSFFFLTLIGQFEGVIEGKGIVLKEGESLFFSGNMKFSLSNPLQRNSVLLLMTSPSFLSA